MSDYAKDPNATSNGYVNELEAALHRRGLLTIIFFNHSLHQVLAKGRADNRREEFKVD